MPDEASTPVKRGRKAASADKEEKVVETKKRQRKDVKPVESGDEEEVSAPKRGRGRPKGSTKKAATTKAKPKAAGRRGRPKKDEKKKESSEEDNDDNEDAEEEEEDD